MKSMNLRKIIVLNYSSDFKDPSACAIPSAFSTGEWALVLTGAECSHDICVVTILVTLPAQS